MNVIGMSTYLFVKIKDAC